MLGHQQIIKYRQQGLQPQAVFFHINSHPFETIPELETENDLDNGFFPSIYTGSTLPSSQSIWYLRGLKIHIISVTPDIELTTQWVLAILELEPSFLIADIEGTIHTWKT